MIFLDNASTTKLNKMAISEIEKSHDLFYNPSAVYGKSLEVKKLLDEAKNKICNFIGTKFNSNLIITASATEADNLAIFGSVKKTDEQIVFSMGEHPAVFNCANELKARGYNVVFVPLNSSGEVDLNILAEILKKPTAFVSIMHVNNETGAINDIAKISKMIKSAWPNAIFHSDGVQAFGKIPVNVVNLGVDLYSISGHKIGAPKGIGCLYVKNISKLKPIIFGGGQEFGIRSGTENTQFILALAKVVENLDVVKNYDYVSNLNNYVREFFSDKQGVVINSSVNSSPYVLSISFDGVRGETLVHLVEQFDVIIGTGSACSSKKTANNRILQAMGISKKLNEGSVRISFSVENSLDEIKTACDIIYSQYLNLKERLK